MTRYLIVENMDAYEKHNRRVNTDPVGGFAPMGPLNYEIADYPNRRPTLRWADTLPKARLKAVSVLKNKKSRTHSVAIVCEGKYEKEGMVYLNRYGTGVWKGGRYTWMINSKDGSIYDKSYSW